MLLHKQHLLHIMPITLESQKLLTYQTLFGSNHWAFHFVSPDSSYGSSRCDFRENTIFQ